MQHNTEPCGYSSSKPVSKGGAISAARRPKVYQQMSKTEVTVIQALCHRAALCFPLGQGLQRLAKLSPGMGPAADYYNPFWGVIVPRYHSFKDMASTLCDDFSKAKSELDGLWYTTLNFGEITVRLKNDSGTAVIHFERGRISFGTDQPDQMLKEKLLQRYRAE